MGRIAEAQRIQIRDRPRAHGEDIAQNAADTRGRALMRFDEAGVVVAFHLEDAGQAFADIDHARILARAADHPGRGGRQRLQPLLRAFVGAMFRPHHREDAEFGHVRHAPRMFCASLNSSAERPWPLAMSAVTGASCAVTPEPPPGRRTCRGHRHRPTRHRPAVRGAASGRARGDPCRIRRRCGARSRWDWRCRWSRLRV